MRTDRFTLSVLVTFLAPTLTAAVRAEAPLGTAFVYQGQLKQSGLPVSGNLDMEFRLFDAPALGNQVGNPVTLGSVDVTNGLFSVTLNSAGEFGSGAFNGNERWLQITIDAVILTPRQEVTPAPYSVRAREGAGGPHALNITSSGDVGIGTTNATAKLHVAGTTLLNGVTTIANGQRIRSEVAGGARMLGSQGNTPASPAIGFMGSGVDDGGGGNGIYRPAANVMAFATGSTERMRITSGGAVGLGTTSPGAKLDVNGAARTTTLEITGGSPLQQPLVGWGDDNFDQITVPNGSFTVVAAGQYHGVAIRNDGTLAGWGLNDDGEINVPPGTFTAVASGGQFHSLAIRSDGTLAAWPPGLLETEPIPAGTFIAVAAGFRHSLAIRTDGSIVGWGHNDFGQINVPPFGTYAAVATGESHSLAIRTDGTLVAWGSDPCGLSNVPPGTFTAIAAGGCHSLAIRSDGQLFGWGRNNDGQTSVPPGTFIAVGAGHAHSLAIRTDGTLVGWGDNDSGQTDVPPGTYVAVAAGRSHSLAIAADPTPGGYALRLSSDSALKPGTNTWTIFSDRRLKKNIKPLPDALDRLLQLRGVTFEWLDGSRSGGGGTQLGLIADEVQAAFPQWVGRDLNGYQTLTIGGFEALTAEAVRELRSEKDGEIAALRSQLAESQARLAALEAALGKLEGRR